MQVVAVFVGLQASGKTTFWRDVLNAGYVHVSKDNFRSARHRQARQLRLVTEALAGGRNVAVDNTNPSPAEWQPLIGAARAAGARVVAYWFPPDLPGSLQRNAARSGRARVPDVGVYATRGRLRQPGPADGFDEVLSVSWDGRGGFRVDPAVGAQTSGR